MKTHILAAFLLLIGSLVGGSLQAQESEPSYNQSLIIPITNVSKISTLEALYDHGNSKKKRFRNIDAKFAVAEDVFDVDGNLIIAKGSLVENNTKIQSRRSVGRPAKIQVEFLSVKGINDDFLLSGSLEQNGKKRKVAAPVLDTYTAIAGGTYVTGAVGLGAVGGVVGLIIGSVMAYTGNIRDGSLIFEAPIVLGLSGLAAGVAVGTALATGVTLAATTALLPLLAIKGRNATIETGSVFYIEAITANK